MSSKWLILAIVVLIYLPVSIDATVLLVATPTLSESLSLSSNELLWIIDIYSLVMAGLILPMGALGDRIGYKRLMMIGGTLFGLASLAAAYSSTAFALIASRGLLAVGAAMILPATLSAVRNTFLDEKQRNIALGIWATVGGGGAAFGPLLGGFLLEHFHWGSVFLINLPIMLTVLIFTVFIIPKQIGQPKQSLNLLQAIILVVAILSMIYAVKSVMHGFTIWTVLIFAIGLSLLVWFVRKQLRSESPMIDIELFKHPVIATGVVMAIVSMMALVGFELLISQELQFVYQLSPLTSGAFILPFMIAISLGGPIASMLVNRFGLRSVASIGMLMSAISLWGLANTDFMQTKIQVWAWMVVLGLSVEIALLASTSAIMSSVPPSKATAAGAIEGMAYELGAGLGIAFFGLMLSWFYANSIMLPTNVPHSMIEQLSSSIGEAVQAAKQLDPTIAHHVITAAKQAFSQSHRSVLNVAALLFLILSIFILFTLPKKVIAIDE
ncbi:SmvA family efflux MFS transporter [Acinetobacter junii]|uniref:SmvA family efflux MFS transporter n=2 Tax=Acinetobacter junii TaxID=40215 RepID=A0AAX1ME72_ACIJU|nr:SmvA family efflux MFS transporter [Acinetobacter junii]QUY35501.1 SmvA family efflux MFS transporter [Acinetobacter junii]